MLFETIAYPRSTLLSTALFPAGLAALACIACRQPVPFAVMSIPFGVMCGLAWPAIFGRPLVGVARRATGLLLRGVKGDREVRFEDVLSASTFTVKGRDVSLALDVRTAEGVVGYVAPAIRRDEADAILAEFPRRHLDKAAESAWALRDRSLRRSAAFLVLWCGMPLLVAGVTCGGLLGLAAGLAMVTSALLTCLVRRLTAANELPRESL